MNSRFFRILLVGALGLLSPILEAKSRKIAPDFSAVEQDPGLILGNVLKRGVRDAAAEKILLRFPEHAVVYAEKVIRARWPEAEPAIAKDAGYSLRYAVFVLKGRFPLAERAIIAKPEVAALYAALCFGKRWPDAERVIATSPEAAVTYCTLVLDGRMPGAEARIFESRLGPRYAVSVVRSRMKDEEPSFIRQDGSVWRNEYFSAFIHSPDEGFEVMLLDAFKNSTISRHALHSWVSSYLSCSRKSEWPEAEPLIMEDSQTAASYVFKILGRRRWPEYEKRIREELKQPDARFGYRRLWYYSTVVDPLEDFPAEWLPLSEKGRDPYCISPRRIPRAQAIANRARALQVESRDAVLSREEAKRLFANPSRAFRYATKVIGGRWPELEQAIASNPGFFSMLYSNEQGDTAWSPDGKYATVFSRYYTDVLKGTPSDAIEAAAIKDARLALERAKAGGTAFVAGESALLNPIRTSDQNCAGEYLMLLQKNPGSGGAGRLFSGPDGARWRLAWLRISLDGYTTDDPGLYSFWQRFLKGP